MEKKEEVFVCPRTGKVIRKKKLPHIPLWATNVIGVFALLWFLIRVIPKPKRITYPCQQIAAPVAMGFLTGVLGFFSLSVLLRNVKRFIYKWKYVLLAISVGTAVFTASCVFNKEDPAANIDAVSTASVTAGSDAADIDAVSTASVTAAPFTEDSPASTDTVQNQDQGNAGHVNPNPDGVMGQGIGINPGRVVWSYNPEATSWDGRTGYWWEDANTDQALVSRMVSESLQSLTGEASDESSWNALFRYFNLTHHGKEQGYQAGEKIAIKVNMNGIGKIDEKNNQCFTSPQVIYAMLKQLVDKAGVPPEDITVFDASREIPDCVFDKCSVEGLKGIRFEGFAGGRGREASERDTSVIIRWSEDTGGNPAYLPKSLTEAKYLINMASLKGHDLAGVTLNAKNHFGTIMTDLKGKPTKNPPQGANIHGYITAHNYGWGDPEWTWPQRPMGTYSPLVDLMAHEHLGGKTLLFLLDGLYASKVQGGVISANCRWKSAPFNNDWPSSILLSQDGLAIDSVGYDFLLNEPLYSGKGGTIKANSTAENYLHEAGQVASPPSKTAYDPEGDGTRVLNLGVHEHWNNANEKKYSRNLGKDYGIELVIQ